MKSKLAKEINNINAVSLIDTGSSDSFLSYNFVKQIKFKIHAGVGQVLMATVSLFSEAKEYCYINIELLGNNYSNLRIALLSNLCTDLIIGHDTYSKTAPELEIKFRSKIANQ